MILAEFKGYGVPYNLVKAEKSGAPSVPGYRCMAAWEVKHTDEKLMEFMETEDRLGNVHTLYHGTPTKNITAIAAEGLRPGGHYCMFGAGIYLGSPSKAIGYAGGTINKWRRDGGASYLLRVRVILGNVKECKSASKHNLKGLQEEGFDSVAGVMGWTSSWGGTLRGHEWVVYSPQQVLVERVYEYQATEESKDPYHPQQGLCAIAVNAPKKVPFDGKGMSAFQDLLVKKPCGKIAYLQVQIPQGQVWICNECLERLRLKVGSHIEIIITSYFGSKPPKKVRIQGIKQ
jgi:hypothetical protein